jgi:hypothetical protein
MTLLSILALGCTSGGQADSGLHSDSGTTESSALQLVGLNLYGAFGFDPELGSAVPYYIAGKASDPIYPWLQLNLTLAAADEFPTPCIITLVAEQNEVPPASWADDELWFGLDWDWNGVQIEDTCSTIDPETYPDTLLGMAQNWNFGLGLLPLSEENQELVRADVTRREGQIEWESEWSDNVVGGAARWDALDEIWTGGWGIGFQVDDDMTLLLQESGTEGPAAPPHDPNFVVAISRADLEAAGGLLRGVYSVDSRIEFDAQELIP